MIPGFGAGLPSVPDLDDVLNAHVTAPAAVALVARGDRVEVGVTGSATPDSIFRIASLTKPVVAAAAMILVEDGRIALDDPVDRWLPELAKPMVVRTPDAPVEDVVPASRPITLVDLLTFRAGYGFPSDFSLPAVQLLFSELLQGPPQPQLVVPPDAWLAALSRIPLLHQPGEAWLYNTASDILGVLIARVAGCSLPEFLAQRVFAPLGMVDTAFSVPAAKRDRFTGYYRAGDGGGLELVDGPDGQWSSEPAFASGAGGLVSTADDLHRFGRMLLDGGGDVLSAASVRQMTTDHLTQAQRDAAELFLEGQGWGYGGTVDVTGRDPWNVPGRYGWVGGTGTAAHVTPATGAVAVLLTQLELAGPTPPAVMREFWTYAGGV